MTGCPRCAQQWTPIFDGGRKAAWTVQAAAADRIADVPDPLGGPGSVIRLAPENGDVAPLTPTTNPRAQLVGPNVLKRGGVYWESWRTLLPDGFPVAQDPAVWVGLGSAAYGPPYNGTSPLALTVRQDRFRVQRNASGNWQVAWEAPIVTGAWTRFAWRFLLDAQGWVEFYVNGQQQSLKAPDKSSVLRLPMPMLDASNADGPWSPRLEVYYLKDAFPGLVAYHGDYRIDADA